MIDLERLGRELESRRKENRIGRAELARGIGVSQTYIWLIEHARPRSSGEPSRPSEDVLRAWTMALGMTDEESRHMRELAGYFGQRATPLRLMSRADRQPRRPQIHMVPASEQATRLGPEAPAGDSPRPLEIHDGADPENRYDISMEDERRLVRQLLGVLQAAQDTASREEVIRLAESFLSWLQTRAESE